ncbi:hypothetical protein HaLaN_32473, partial [Haematococcus lacustris]
MSAGAGSPCSKHKASFVTPNFVNFVGHAHWQHIRSDATRVMLQSSVSPPNQARPNHLAGIPHFLISCPLSQSSVSPPNQAAGGHRKHSRVTVCASLRSVSKQLPASPPETEYGRIKNETQQLAALHYPELLDLAQA